MGEVLALVRRGSFGVCPTWRARCSNCRRVYVVTTNRHTIEGQRYCAECRPPPPRPRAKTLAELFDTRSARYKRELARRALADLCRDCGKPAEPDKSRCAKHLATDAARSLRRYYAKKLQRQ